MLPFVVLILLSIPEFLHAFYARRQVDAATSSRMCATAARILCLVGVLRALGFIGPPLLDGIGQPELTLRYMVVAAIARAGLVRRRRARCSAIALGFLSVAVAWAVGYPIAFAVLSYLVVEVDRSAARDVPARQLGDRRLLRSPGSSPGSACRWRCRGRVDAVRMLAIGGATLVVTLALLATWQRITPRSIMAAIKG